MPIRPFFADNPIMLGALYGVLQSIFFAFVGLTVKLASEDHHTIQIVFFRNFIMLIIVFAIIIAIGKYKKIFEANLKRQTVRGVAGTTGMVLTFVTFDYLPLSEAQALLFAAPLFVVLLSFPILKEKVGPIRTLATFIGFLGILLIVQPGTISSGIGAVFGIAAALGHATIMILLRILGKSEDPLITVFYFGSIGTLLSLPFLPFVWSWPDLFNWSLLIGVGVAAVGVQICLTNSYLHAPASIIAPITYTNIIWAIMLDLAIWGYVPNITILIGAGIVIAANAIIIYREHKKDQARKHDLIHH